MTTILGIDPGLVRTGWGMIECNGVNDISHIASGIIITHNKQSLENRIVKIQNYTLQLLEMYKPDAVAMEEVFINVNAKTSEKLIMARTAIFAAVASRNMKINGYKPNTIKKVITGNGHSSKNTVQIMVNAILKQKINVYKLDTIDALAVAITHCYSSTNCY